MHLVLGPDGSLKSPMSKFLNREQQSELIRALNIQVDDVVVLAAGEHKKAVGKFLVLELNITGYIHNTWPLQFPPA